MIKLFDVIQYESKICLSQISIQFFVIEKCLGELSHKSSSVSKTCFKTCRTLWTKSDLLCSPSIFHQNHDSWMNQLLID